MKQLFFLLVVGTFSLSAQPGLYKTVSGSASFVSEAPLEIIKASSNALSGLLHVQQKNFAFTIPVKTFQGFNSALQREHFHENYMESEKYPTAVFKGKIREQVDLSASGNYAVNAEGTLTIHGVTKPVVVRGSVISTGNELKLEFKFQVRPEDYQVKVPSLVITKIAEVIDVSGKMTLIKK